MVSLYSTKLGLKELHFTLIDDIQCECRFVEKEMQLPMMYVTAHVTSQMVI